MIHFRYGTFPCRTSRLPAASHLHGEVRCSGAKNAALPIMAAAILASEPVRLENVPYLADVRTQAAVLRCLGMRVAWNDIVQQWGRHSSAPLCSWKWLILGRSAHRRDWCGGCGPSFCVLGPLLARRGRAVVPLPGGCNIGHRPVDLHLKGLAALGAQLQVQRGYVVAAARRLHGAPIDLSGPNGPTVTGTANVMSAAVLARGTTVIRGAALEPEIVDLGNFLIALGARIDGLGTSTIRIEGVDQLGGADAPTHPRSDRGGHAVDGRGDCRRLGHGNGRRSRHLTCVLETLRAAGAEINVAGDRVSIAARRPLRAVDVVAEAYPGFPTDIQAQWTALMSVAEGVSSIEDRVFPGRFLHLAELNRLGAKVAGGHGAATVTGVTRLSGARVTACDLRASAALVLAGLAAEGRTIVDHIHHLDRGYQQLDDKLRQLGARVERVAEYCLPKRQVFDCRSG